MHCSLFQYSRFTFNVYFFQVQDQWIQICYLIACNLKILLVITDKNKMTGSGYCNQRLQHHLIIYQHAVMIITLSQNLYIFIKCCEPIVLITCWTECNIVWTSLNPFYHILFFFNLSVLLLFEHQKHILKWLTDRYSGAIDIKPIPLIVLFQPSLWYFLCCQKNVVHLSQWQISDSNETNPELHWGSWESPIKYGKHWWVIRGTSSWRILDPLGQKYLQ